MKYLILLFISVAVYNPAQTQIKNEINRWAVDVQAGIVLPTTLIEKNSTKGYIALSSLQTGVRYSFSTKWGLRINYGYHNFQNKNNKLQGLDFNTLGLSGVYNYQFDENLGLLAHAGLGYARAKPSTITNTEQTLLTQLGITPQFKINDRIAVFVDTSLFLSFKQQYYFDGSLVSEDYKGYTASFLILNLGAQVYLGNKRKRHADWVY
jgi:OOP family OmpA-OmpF porin